ncbi:MAG TPA: hypothetical protein VMX54_07495, partial [Vicinamibacteria bacterium]|nr:hypothetical protein [Vicinamibacteria bacterium]
MAKAKKTTGTKKTTARWGAAARALAADRLTREVVDELTAHGHRDDDWRVVERFAIRAGFDRAAHLGVGFRAKLVKFC